MRSNLSVLAEIQARSVEVRNHEGELVGRVPREKVDGLIAAGLVSPIGRKGFKYLVVSGELHVPRPQSWRGGNRTTRPVRADGTCAHYGAGQLMGNPRMLREHNAILK